MCSSWPYSDVFAHFGCCSEGKKKFEQAERTGFDHSKTLSLVESTREGIGINDIESHALFSESSRMVFDGGEQERSDSLSARFVDDGEPVHQKRVGGFGSIKQR